eukprot:10910443-Ditylum_brightwellii.AAC.1
MTLHLNTRSCALAQSSMQLPTDEGPTYVRIGTNLQDQPQTNDTSSATNRSNDNADQSSVQVSEGSWSQQDHNEINNQNINQTAIQNENLQQQQWSEEQTQPEPAPSTFTAGEQVYMGHKTGTILRVHTNIHPTPACPHKYLYTVHTEDASIKMYAPES